jgi:hypothetical protein
MSTSYLAALDTDESDARRLQADVLFERKEFKAAAENYKVRLTLLGLARTKGHLSHTCTHVYQASLKADSSNVLALKGYAAVMAQAGALPQAGKVWQRILLLRPDLISEAPSWLDLS